MKSDNPQHVEREWQDFAKKVFPGPTVSRIQYDEMHKAFFAGAQAILYRILQLVETTPGTEPTKGDLTLMDDINEELLNFLDRVKRGEPI